MLWVGVVVRSRHRHGFGRPALAQAAGPVRAATWCRAGNRGVRADPVSLSGTTGASISPRRSRVGTVGRTASGVTLSEVLATGTADNAGALDDASGSRCAVTAPHPDRAMRAMRAIRHSRSHFMSEPRVDGNGHGARVGARLVRLTRLARPRCERWSRSTSSASKPRQRNQLVTPRRTGRVRHGRVRRRRCGRPVDRLVGRLLRRLVVRSTCRTGPHGDQLTPFLTHLSLGRRRTLHQRVQNPGFEQDASRCRATTGPWRSRHPPEFVVSSTTLRFIAGGAAGSSTDRRHTRRGRHYSPQVRTGPNLPS